MTKTTAWMLGTLALLLVMGAEWAGLRHYYGRSPLASIEGRATNAGKALDPLAVRVYVYPTGRPWELVTEGPIDQALPVPPGRYDVRLLLDASADQQSEWFREIELEEGDRVTKEAAFAAGELSIIHSAPNASETEQLLVYVFAPDDHDQIITSLTGSESVLLAAGEYDLRAVLSQESGEKGVRWIEGVEVQAGARAAHEVRFQRGVLLVHARNGTETLSSEAVEVRIFRAGDEQEEVVDWGRAEIPLSLERGRYDVELTFALSNDRPTRWLRDAEILEGKTLERSVEFSSGSVAVLADLPGGQRLRDFEAYTYYYRAGDHREPVAYTPAGETVVLESGRYDARVYFFRSHDQPNVWIRGIDVQPGQGAEYTTTFRSGRLLVRAYDPSRHELIGDDVFLYVYAAADDPAQEARAGGVKSRPSVVARSGTELVLSAGQYDLRLEDTRSPGSDQWLRGVEVIPGKRIELEATFGADGASRSVSKQDAP